MKVFTKSFLALLLMMVIGVVGASAKTEKVHATFESPNNTNTTWDAETKTFTWSTTYYNQLRNIGLPNGDITKYKKLVVDCTIKSGEKFRILFYKGGSNLTLYAEDGVNEFILADALKEVAPNDYNEYLLACDEICLSGNNGAAPGEAVINDVYLETYDDEGTKVEATFESPNNTNTTWDAETKTFTWSTTYYNQLRNIGLPNGDISKYKKLVVDCSIKSGEKFRILFYKGGSNLTLYAEDGVNEFILADALKEVAPNDYNEYLLACDEICLSGNNGAAPGEAVINSVYLETYPENESIDVPEITYEEDPGKPEGNYVDFTEAFPDLQPRIGLGADEHPIVLGNGEVVVGARTQNVIADLSDYTSLTLVGTPGLKVVFYMNHEVAAQQNAGDYAAEDEGKYVFLDAQLGEDGLYKLDLTQFDKQDLNAICLPWDNSNKGTVWYILLEEKAIADGKYYFKNVGAGLYWGASNNWGTQASLVSEQQYGTLARLEDGTYTLESMVSNGGNNYYFGGAYMDGTAAKLTIKKKNGNYTIANVDGTLYYGYDGASTVLATSESAESENFQWQLITEEEMEAERANVIAAATAEEPADVTFLITDAYFGRNRRDVSAWTMEANNKNLTGGGDKGGCAESYHSVFSLSQVIANAPKGVYKLGASAFYRQDGSDQEHLPYIYLSDGTNTETSPFGPRTGSENDMNSAAGAFNNGLYKLEPVVFELAEEGDMTVGAKLEENATLWCIWGRFTLTYYGPDADFTQVQLGELIAKVDELRAKAEELKAAAGVPADVVTAIEEAVNGAAEIEASKEAYNTAIAALQTAVDNAQAYVNAKAYFDKMASVLDNTNVYTKEAYDAVYGTWLAEYNAGTLAQETAATLNEGAAFSNGWHSANNIDDVLLSAWTIGGEQAANYDKALYINTWSVEGDNDGTNFKVPFFEYWTADANSLGANTIAATLEGVPAGDYIVKAWVRARAKNGTAAADATGITLSANDGEATDVTEGEAVGSFNIGEYTANATVAEDGKLTITFDVAAENNISWLSFKDVKYLTPAEAAQEELNKKYEAALATITDGNYYKISTQVGETTYFLTSAGALTADEAEATAFEFKAVNADKTAYATGWNLGYKFTNPEMNGGGNGTPKNGGVIRTETKNDRNNYERQVFFYNGEEYAVRATNAEGESWGANTFWTAFDGETVTAGYGANGEPAYIWSLTDVTADAILATAEDIVDAKANVGDALFQIPEAAFTTYQQAVTDAAAIINNEASTPEEIAQAVADLKAANAAYAATAVNAPKADVAYAITNATADGDLGISAEGIKITKNAAVYFTPVAGGFALSNEAGEYIFKTTDNGWTLSTTTDIAQAYVISVNPVEGGYTLQGANGLIGSDATDEGATLYANKAQSNNGLWTIAEFVPEIAWSDNLIKNGDMEGDDISCFFAIEPDIDEPYNASITAGAGKDGSAGIEVRSTDNPAQEWDTQFFVRLPYVLPAGTQYKLEFDYKASETSAVSTQSHYEPADYNANAIGDFTFTADWQTYSQEGTIDNTMAYGWGGDKLGFMTLVFNLAKEKTARTYSFDNFKFYVLSDVLPTLQPSPARDIVPKPEPPVAIEGIQNAPAKADGKYIENGKVIILKNGVKYNVAGQAIR